MFRIGGNTFYNRKNKILMKIPEFKRSGIGLIVELRGILNGFPNQVLDWGILYPHKFQICAIHDIVFHGNQIICLIAKMGSGKLAVLLTVGSLQTGVTVTMVPLV